MKTWRDKGLARDAGVEDPDMSKRKKSRPEEYSGSQQNFMSACYRLKSYLMLERTRGQEEERVLQRLPSLKTGPSLSPEIPWCCWTRPNTGIGHPCSCNRKQKALSEATTTKSKHRASKFLFFSYVLIDLLWVGNEIVSLPVCFLSPAKNFSITWLNIVISFSCFVL